MSDFVRVPSRVRPGPVIVLAYVALAIVLGQQGNAVGARLFGHDVSPISSASANAILSAIASGMMALTAIVFSLVLVAVQHSAASYSPRLVRLIGDNRFIAHALGIFTGTFVYAIVALRTVDIAGREGIDVSVVGFAFAWLAASIAILVMLVPRMRGLSVERILLNLQRRGAEAISRIYPESLTSPEKVAPAPDLRMTSTIIHGERPMYVVGLDLPRLVRYAREVDAVIVIHVAIGDAVIAGDRLASTHGGTGTVSDRRLRDAIWLADERIVANDPAYAIRLLVDVAIRALSPAVNDPTTAVSVLDKLDGLLRSLAGRCLDVSHARDEHGVVRVVRAVPTWDDLVRLALTEVHQYGAESIQVEHRLAALVHDLLRIVPAERRPAIERFARWRDETLATPTTGHARWFDASIRDRQGIGHQLLAN